MGLLGRITAVALLAAALAWPAGGAAGPGDGFAVQEAEGGPAPGFVLEGTDGAVYGLGDFRGRVVLLHFWASWCAPCRVEMPALMRLHEELGAEGLTVLLVAEDSVKNARAYAEEHGLELPVLVDRYGGVMRDYGVKVLPTSVVLGRNGEVRAYMVGQRDYSGRGSFEFFGRLLERNAE